MGERCRLVLAVALLLVAMGLVEPPLAGGADRRLTISAPVNLEALTEKLRARDAAVTGVSLHAGTNLTVHGGAGIAEADILADIAASPPAPVAAPDAMRRALGSIFAGTPAQKRARWGAVLEAYPASAVLLTLLRDPLTADGKATITEVLSRIKARIGQANQVLTQEEYDALAALAATHNLGGIVP